MAMEGGGSNFGGGSSSDPMSYTLVPEGQTVRPAAESAETPTERPRHPGADGSLALDAVDDSLSTNSSKDLPPSQHSSSTDDTDEEVLYHFLRMQLYHAKILSRRFRSRGYRTMVEIAAMDAAVFEEMQMGSGDTQKLAQGLQRYREGTFNDFYQLPLEHIVQTSVSRSTQADSSRLGVEARADVDVSGAGPVVLPQAVGQGAEALAAAREHRVSIFEAVWVGTSWSGVAISALVAFVVRCLGGAPVKSQSKRGRFIELLLQYIFAQGVALAGITLPCLTLAHLLCGLVRPVRSVGLGTVGGGMSAAAAATAYCMSTNGDCFDSSARVLLPNRSHKSISDIVEGDLILSFNRGVFRVKKVLSRITSAELQPMSRICYRLPDGEVGSIETTAGHPLWVASKGWRASPNLADDADDKIGSPIACQAVQIDDVFVHFTGAAARVVSIEPYTSTSPACNIVVDGPGTFFVNSVLVHTSMQDIGPLAKAPGHRRQQCSTTPMS